MTCSWLLSTLLAAGAFAGSKVEPGVGRVGAPRAPVVGLPALELRLLRPAPAGSLPIQASEGALRPLDALAPQHQPQAPASQAQAPAEQETSSGRRRFDGAGKLEAGDVPAVPAGAASAPRALVDAYQHGRLDEVGATSGQKALLEDAARRAIRAKLASASFTTFRTYGILSGANIYHAPELPGVVLKTYGMPFYLKGGAYRGYVLAKERLGGLFAETTIVEDVEVTINGRKRRLPWALVQQKVNLEGLADFARRDYAVRLGMLNRGVRDHDVRDRRFEEIEQNRNVGETEDGRMVHFDADRFKADSEIKEKPVRLRDPAALREAIEAEQLAALAGRSAPQLELAAAEELIARSLADKEPVRRQVERVMRIGRRGGFDGRPAVAHLVDRIARGKSFEYKKDLYVVGASELTSTGLLDVTVHAVHHKPQAVPKWSGWLVGRAQNPAGAASAYSQILYGVLKGVALKAARDPSVTSVRITAWRVMNPDLQRTFEALGFNRSRPDLPADFPQAWALQFPIQR